ncbi:LOW QUALITY PROTEIN: nucleolar protein 8 [Discoglossus pictus]
MSVLNKSKWKGGVLQIEMAKESFLNRLAEERQAAKEKKDKPRAQPQPDLVQSLKEAGVTEFQMKAAVPGTEVQNHKDWVVSKYGRVLSPVLHLQSRHFMQNLNTSFTPMNIIKYDPSKYCHNIKKLDDSSVDPVPVSQLTWHLDGGDDEISRKRRGEFPTPKNPVKKKPKVEHYLETKEVKDAGKCNTRICKGSERLTVASSGGLSAKGFKKEVNGLLIRKTRNSLADEDSEEELQDILERGKTQKASLQITEDSNLEVVKDSFELSYTTHWGRQKEANTKKEPSSSSIQVKDDREYDSADTDEIIAVAKTVQKDKDLSMKMEGKPSGIGKECLLAKKQNNSLGSPDTMSTERKKTAKEERGNESDSENVEEDSGSDSSDSYSDEDYKSMMQNCYRLDLSFGELEKLASAAQESSEDDTTDSDGGEEMETSNVQTPSSNPRRKTVIAPEDILASIMENDHDSCDEQPKKKKVKVPAFQGLTQAVAVPSNKILARKTRSSTSGSETDPEKEIKILVEKEKAEKGGLLLNEDSHLEVVDDSFALSYTTHWDRRKEASAKKELSTSNSKGKDDREYDSEDTDEIIAVAKTVQKDNNAKEIEGKDLGKEQLTLQSKTNLSSADVKSKKTKCIEKESDSESEEEDSVSENSSDSGLDEEYRSMIQNCQRIELTLGDLKKLASEAKEPSEDDSDDDKPELDEKDIRKTETPAATQKKRTGIEPEDIVASILEDIMIAVMSDVKKKAAPVILPAFKGLGSLLGRTQSEDKSSVNTLHPKSSAPSTALVTRSSKVVKDGEDISKKNNKQGSDSEGEHSSRTAQQSPPTSNKQKKDDAQSSSSSDTSSDESSSDDESSDNPSSAPPHNNVKGTSPQVSAEKSNAMGQTRAQQSGTKQLQDNQKRLAAMEERRKERELQKQAIQGALLKQDSQPSNKGHHIVFDSEEENEEEEVVEVARKPGAEQTAQVKMSYSKARLFMSSEEESEGDEEQDDQGRFKIKSQYEGRSGEKLMQLQSRFGTDERMDSRFLDKSSEDEAEKEATQKSTVNKEDDDLSAEKKKNLSILQSLLNINVQPQPQSKQAAKAKKFKDLNALHYDPTSEDHAAFEAQTEENKKESKSERKKKRLEAEKLPEVSTEIHEVTVDLKEVFGASKPIPVSEDTVKTWDQEEEPVEMEEESTTTQEGFNFQKKRRANSYKIETIKPAKVAWQGDPRFQDSSSEDEEEEELTMADDPKTSLQSESANPVCVFSFSGWMTRDEKRVQRCFSSLQIWKRNKKPGSRAGRSCWRNAEKDIKTQKGK